MLEFPPEEMTLFCVRTLSETDLCQSLEVCKLAFILLIDITVCNMQ